MTVAGTAPPATTVSVFDRLRAATLIAFAVGVILAIFAAWTFADAVAKQSYDRLLLSGATQIADTLDIVDGQVAASPPDAAFKTLALAEGDRFFYSVRAPDGRLVTGYPDLPAVAVGAREREIDFANAQFKGVPVRIVTVRHFLAPAGTPGMATVSVAQTLESRRTLTLALLAKVSATILFVGGVGLAAFLAAARQALAPLRRVGEQLADRETADFSPLSGGYPREVAALVETINAMLARVADRLARLHGFTAVAAHQIRTPLAALSAQIDVMRAEATAPEQQSRIARIGGRVDALGRLTQQLLGHAMVAYRTEAAPRSRLDVAEVAREATSAGLPTSLERDIEVQFRAPSDAILVEGDRAMLHEAMRNLIDNAVQHGAPGGLEVDVSLRGDTACLTVRDDGPGFPASQWQAASEPFGLVREAGGAGLGLSIARAVALAHAGTLDFGFDARGWFAVTMTLPIARSPA